MENGQFQRDGYLRENFRFFHLRDTAGQEKDYHYHEFDKLVLLLSGRVAYEIETSSYDLQPGDVLLVRHHAIHKADIDISEPYDRIILYIDARYVERAAPGERLMTCFDVTDSPGKHRLTPDERSAERVRTLTEALEAALSDEDFGADTMRRTLLMQLLVEINRLVPSQRREPSAPDADDKIGRTLSYINENLSGDLTVDQLAARAYLSRYHFMRLFKEKTGSTVHAYIRRKRLLLAAQRIREGTPPGLAAEEIGYTEYSSFYRAFRDCFGASPSDIQ